MKTIETYTWGLWLPSWVERAFEFFESRGVVVLRINLKRSHWLTCSEFVVRPADLAKMHAIMVSKAFNQFSDTVLPRHDDL